MKKIVVIIVLFLISGCSAITRKYGEYKINSARNSFITNGLSIEAFSNLTEGLQIIPLSPEGISTFNQQYNLVENIGEDIKRKNRDRWNIKDFKEFYVYIYSKESYEKLPMETKGMLRVEPVSLSGLRNDKILITSQLEKYLSGRNLKNYSRENLKEWYRLVQRNNRIDPNNYNLKNIEKKLENILVIKVAFSSQGYFNYKYGLDYILPKLIREKEGNISEFIKFIGYENRYNSNETKYILELNIGNVDDYVYDRKKEEKDNKTIIIEKRRVRISGFYDILETKSNRIIDKNYFSESRDYDVFHEYDEDYWDRGEKSTFNRNIESMLNKILEEAFFNLKNIENKIQK